MNVQKNKLTFILLLLITVFLLVSAGSWFFNRLEVINAREIAPYDLPSKSDVYKQYDFSNALARPLFWESRRPVKEDIVQPSTPELSELEGVHLVGVIVKDMTQTALLQTEQGIVRASIGTTVDGWKVASIEQNKVILVADDGREVVLVNELKRPDSIQLSPVN